MQSTLAKILTKFQMFLRSIRSFDKVFKSDPFQFSRSISQTTPNPIESRPSAIGRSLKHSDIKQIPNTSSSMKLNVLKRIPRKKPLWDSVNIPNQREGQYFNVSAFATADWYDLNRLKQRLNSLSNSYKLIDISGMIDDVLCLQIYTQSIVKRQAFIFDDGAVVFWNVEQNDEQLILNEVNK